VPANKLTEEERITILATANQEKFANLPPSQIVPKLADEGVFIASESTFYRTLRADKQLAHRGRTKAAKHKRPLPVLATEPNQLWSWDITYLNTTVKGLYFYPLLTHEAVVQTHILSSLGDLHPRVASAVPITTTKRFRVTFTPPSRGIFPRFRARP
jgi:transposase InsO family protein